MSQLCLKQIGVIVVIKSLEAAVAGFGSVVQNAGVCVFAICLDFPLCLEDCSPKSRLLKEEQSKAQKLPYPPF